MNIAVKAKKRYESGKQPYLTGLSMAFVFCGFFIYWHEIFNRLC